MRSHNKAWVGIVIGALFEVGWVVGLKHANSVWDWAGTVVAIIVSFGLLILSSRVLPVGTSYAVFVGLGTAGTIVADIVLFDAPVKPVQLILIGVLLVGVVGLKVLGDSRQKEAEAS